MNQKIEMKKKIRDAKQARQAHRVLNGIFIGLIILMVIVLLAYWLLV